MKKVLKWLICGCVGLGLVGVAYAQFTKPEDAIKYRQAIMVVMAHHFGQIAAMVQGKQPIDARAVEKEANLVQALSSLPWDAFMVPGSQKGKTHLKASAFDKNEADFKADADNLMIALVQLAQAADRGQAKAIKSQFGVVAKSCKTCHTKYLSR